MSLIVSKILTEQEVAEIILKKSTQVACHFLAVRGEKGKGKVAVKAREEFPGNELKVYPKGNPLGPPSR